MSNNITSRYVAFEDIIKYNKKEYKVIKYTNCVEGSKNTHEIIIYPIENGIVSNKEVYKSRLYDVINSIDKYLDILENPELYLDKKK